MPTKVQSSASDSNVRYVKRISERGQVTIPKELRERLGINNPAKVEMIATREGLLIRKQTAADHPVDLVFGILGHGGSTDEFLRDIRGR